MNTQNHAIALARQFGFEQKNLDIKPIGNGHINTTLLLKHPEGATVVQKLNTQVFPEPDKLVENARAIEQHLSKKLENDEYQLNIIKHVPTVDEQYLIDIQGEVWRGLEFIGGSYSEDVVQSQSQAQEAANAFGQFAAALSDFDAKQLYPVIKDFHNLAMRLRMLEDAVQANKHGRLTQVQSLVDFCRQQTHLVEQLEQAAQELPLRPCHNDTKINNMLFCNKNNKAKAVIDLDTCMPGYWLFDFGDMVRTFCSAEEEDSTALDKVCVRKEIFSALVEGYVAPLRELITEQEKMSFWLGAQVMPFMIGVRFLTDYLDGDNYFAIKREHHNLDRAKNQFALYQDLVANAATLKPIIEQA